MFLYSEKGDVEFRELPLSSCSMSFWGDKEKGIIILAYPVGPGGFRMRPAGGYLEGVEEVELSFEKGAPLSVLVNALAAGYDLRQFNCTRFLNEWDWAGLSSPWFIDWEGLEDKILSGNFRVSYIKGADLFPLEGEEGWLSEDVFLESGVPDSLPAGRHSFYHPGEEMIRKVIIDGEGNVISGEFSVSSE
ncbi:MAG: hypothetical protein PQJ59_05360 [Spirochaetales bacterium]|nr:hypothetical protein [Spirochaetales bacterium]